MFRLLVVLAAVLVSCDHGTWGQTITEPQCEKTLAGCLNHTAQDMAKGMKNFNFATICQMMLETGKCYKTEKNNPICKSFNETLKVLDDQNTQQMSWFCPGGTPDQCLVGLQACVNSFRTATNTTDKTAVCAASTKARLCMNQLTCSAPAQSMLSTFEQEISQRITASACFLIDAATPCTKSLANCLLPLERRLKSLESIYDFEGVCSAWPKLQACYNTATNDPSCSSEMTKVNSNKAFLTTRYHQYCDSNDKPKQCMKVLENCTQEQNAISSSPRAKLDPVYFCQFSQIMKTCVDKVAADVDSCPVLNTVQGIANYQQTQKALDTICSNVLTQCTKTPAKCIVWKDQQLQTAIEMSKYDQACSLAHDYKQCVWTYQQLPECKSNIYLQTELAYITNITSLGCQANDQLHAKPCLQSVQRCSEPFFKIIDNFDTITHFCSAQATFMKCINGIKCSDKNLEQQLNATRQKGQRSECTGSATSVPVSVMLMILAAVLTLWA